MLNCRYLLYSTYTVLVRTVVIYVNTKFFQTIYFCGTNLVVKINIVNFPIAFFPPLTKLSIDYRLRVQYKYSTIFRSNDATWREPLRRSGE